MINIASGIFYLLIFSFSLYLGKNKNDKSLVIFVITMLAAIFLWQWLSGLFGVSYYVYPKFARWILMICFFALWSIIAYFWKKEIGFTPISIISFFFANSSIYLLTMYGLTIFGIINVA